jgi:hypothetical protein
MEKTEIKIRCKCGEWLIYYFIKGGEHTITCSKCGEKYHYGSAKESNPLWKI